MDKTIRRVTDFEEQQAWPNRIDGEVDGIPACIISREDMIRNKVAVGRYQDLADVERLRAAERATRPKSS
jgi:hypothetical protein